MVEQQYNQNLETLITQIYERVGQPVSGNATQAMIESFGVREVDVLEDYGYASIKELTVYVHQQLLVLYKLEKENDKQKAAETKELDSFYKKATVFIKFYSIELFHLSPVFFQVVCFFLPLKLGRRGSPCFLYRVRVCIHSHLNQ